ncbi:MAG TPA: GDSL-type esterase/lipase family protein [Allosphingosinicella sp.]|nr:GDSL-type esterase/lipase family protein [Allosphingosinicella sp.]
MIALSLFLAAAACEAPAALVRHCPGETFHILQLGDSHTAGDIITQPLRRLLQLRFGAAGRGVLAPGRPYAGYLTYGVTADQSGVWTVSASFGPAFPGSRPVGLSGYTLTSASAGAAIGLTSDDEANRFDRFVVCALREPGAGTLRLRVGDREEGWPLASPRRDAACRTVDSDVPAETASLVVSDDRAVSITSLATFRRAGGIVVSNLGVSGSQLAHLSREHEAVVRAEFDAYRPDLIVLAFGTNEAFSPRFDADSYERELRRGIARIRRLAGAELPILLVAPPGAATRDLALAGNGGLPLRTCGPRLYAPTALDRVRERQRLVADELGLGFLDARAAMGGPCAAPAWAARGWMRADLVHFTRAGGEQLGWMFAAALLQAQAR